MAYLLVFFLETSPAVFYLVNNIFDTVFSLALSTLYIFFVASKELKLFLFIIGLFWFIFAVVILLTFIIDESFTSIHHKRYFQTRLILSATLVLLFLSSTVQLADKGLGALSVFFESLWFLFALLVLGLVIVWSQQMVDIIRTSRESNKARLAEQETGVKTNNKTTDFKNSVIAESESGHESSSKSDLKV